MPEKKSFADPANPHSKRQADPIDLMVAINIKRRRVDRGLSRLQLAEHLGISLQQMAKYETGSNRVSAARLYAIAQALEVSVGWFYRQGNLLPEAVSQPSDRPEGITPASAAIRTLVRDFENIQRDDDRATLLDIAKAFTRRSR